MPIFLFANNAATTLAGPVSNTSLTATLAAGTGALFPNPGPGQIFAMTFQSASNLLLNEIVYVTNRTGDVVTILRGQENTTAQNWNANDIASQFITAGQMTSFAQSVVGGVIGSSRNAKMSVTNPAATATFSADEIVVAASLSGASYNLSSYSQTINLATVGAGGMDIGAAPLSGYVALYAIYNPANGNTSILATNATASVQPSIYGGANMPAGYTASALISVWRTDASRHFVTGQQVGRRIATAPTVALNTASTPATPQLTTSTAFPMNANSISGVLTIESSSNSAAELDVYSDVNDSGWQAISGSVAATEIKAATFTLLISSPQTFAYKATYSAGTPQSTVSVTSYVI